MDAFISRKRKRKVSSSVNPTPGTEIPSHNLPSVLSQGFSQDRLSDSQLPSEWRILKYQSISPESVPIKSLLLGVTYSKESLSYELYITDLSNVWYECVTSDQFKNKASTSELGANPTDIIFDTVSDLFRSQFSNEEFPIRTKLKFLDNDTAVMNVVQDFDQVKLNWSFSLHKLPLQENIKLLSHIIFQLSSVIANQNSYQVDLLKQIEKKDSTIRYFHESLKGMRNGDGIIKRYGGNLQPFDQESFRRSWIEKAHNRGLNYENTVSLMEANESCDIWDFNVKFNKQKREIKEEKDIKKEEKDNLNELVVMKDEFQSFYGPEIEDIEIEPKEEVNSQISNSTTDFEFVPQAQEQHESNVHTKTENETTVIPADQETTLSSSGAEPTHQDVQPIRRGFVSKRRKVKRDANT